MTFWFVFQLVVMMGIRKLLDFFFTPNELKILDDILPEFHRNERIDDEEQEAAEKEADKAAEAEAEKAKRRQSIR